MFLPPDNVRIAAAYYIGTEKKLSIPLQFVFLAISAAICMVASEIVARIKRKRISPVQAANSNNTRGKNMVISNLIPFTNLNLIMAFNFVVGSFIKVFATTEMGVPTISINTSVTLLLLVFTNSEARSHFKRKVVAWRRVDIVEGVQLQQQPFQREQATNPQPNIIPNVHLPNQTYQETVN